VEKQQKSPPSQVQVQIDPGEAEGIYANVVLFAHSHHEFILDFARMLPGLQRAKVFSRIILTPQTAKSLLRGLESRIKGFESQHGQITVQGDSTPQRDIGFKTETP
jgi:hypothetical protein